ncbi:MAG: hypothetical protein EOM77_01105 [Bacteroidia bacterium]|nr:hypothetical protein [Bacteroidia bacterium]
MNYRLQKNAVIGFFVLSGSILMLGILWYPLSLLIIHIQNRIKQNDVNERLNLEYFEEVISANGRITIFYSNNYYSEPDNGFRNYYLNTHNASNETEYSEFVPEFSVTINDGDYSFIAEYSSQCNYFKLDYIAYPYVIVDDEDIIAPRNSKMFTYDSSYVESLVNYLF